MQEVRQRCNMAVSANEGLWTPEDALRQMTARTADVYCFSPYFTGSLAQFQRLSWFAHYQGLDICRHTHGELGITAQACHHILLTLPNVVDGNQQTAHMMTDDIVVDTIPITNGPDWGVPDKPGIGVEIEPRQARQVSRAVSRAGSVRALRSRVAGNGIVSLISDASSVH